MGVKSIQRTVHPWNESQNEHDAWKAEIHDQLEQQLLPSHMLIVEANKILTRAPYYRPTSKKERVNSDRITYLIMFITAIALAVAISTTN